MNKAEGEMEHSYIMLCFFSVRLLSALECVAIRGFSSVPQWSMTSDFEGFLSQILFITCFALFCRKSQYFPF